MSDIIRQFGKRVKFYRMKQKISQERLAEIAGLHPTYIGQVERGEKNCTLETAEKVANGLGVPLEELVSDLSDRSSDSSAANKDNDEIRYIIKHLIDMDSRKLAFISNMIERLKDL